MKKLLFASLLGLLSFGSLQSEAQINVNINLASQPEWGPTGYNHVDYYYLPDMDMYYYVPSKQYIYQENNNWVWRNSLPARYRGHDMYNSYKVVMNTKKPYLNHGNHLGKYSSFKNKKGAQNSLRDHRGNATPQKRATSQKNITSHRTVKQTVKTSPAHNNTKAKGQKNNKNGNQGKR
ncbi:hypothetical protein [Arcticibacter eurypsychrophilus]|uniref:hypothetical protein n=1 Tax=Arcticibacter eurypsychrophilus TaxID=1434752 RepID=UPI00084DC4C3|nr:hypothetical protein [Arcticibacter eurypsychrophilus]